jgi:ABC-2 type transport system ATP-binding protein
MPADSRLYTVTPLGALQVPTMNLGVQSSGSTLWLWPMLAIASMLIAFIYYRIRRPVVNRPSNESNPPLIKVSQLAKSYSDGYRAVDGISFSVDRGQVVGLLGPNGAGKTTTLRMLMGLIYPSEGEIFLDGEQIYPGAKALSGLGSFVEGPGFLPHLSGRENLNLYWRSIGRDDSPEFEQVLTITKLGGAVDKKVRSYSQGMRQRLAIAQAMLGLPDLLILDEPTNGLDPQQITEMRQVLRDYAATGRTVLISSHLLSEVEQTCSHVVLMHRGKLLAAGSIETLLNQGHKGESLEEFFLEIIGDDLIIGKEKA